MSTTERSINYWIGIFMLITGAFRGRLLPERWGTSLRAVAEDRLTQQYKSTTHTTVFGW